MGLFKLIISASMLIVLSNSCLDLVEGRKMGTNMVNKLYQKDYQELNSKRWAILVAGSKGYENYRHQADICHAYQILKKNGVKDEHIIVFMYDDIAYHKDNPTPGVIINKPKGENVYVNVPHDYVGDDVSASNFLAVLLGNETGVTGGSGKVLKSSRDDEVFIYFSGHGKSGALAMPGDNGDALLASAFIDALKSKAASYSFDTMLIYVEACLSGSIFRDLPNNLAIYVTTASNETESSYGTYCGKNSDGRKSCLGNMYSVSWMEDSDQSDPAQETLGDQYAKVQQRTTSSHVMKYGDVSLDAEFLALYFAPDDNLLRYEHQNHNYTVKVSDDQMNPPLDGVEQLEASLLYFMEAVIAAPEGSLERKKAQEDLATELAHRRHVDCVFYEIGKLIFDTDDYYEKIMAVQSPIVDDWNCYQTMIATFKSYCGGFSMYAMKYIQAFANMCNAGFTQPRLSEVASQVCPALGTVIPSCKGS
ncbi:Vacuolar-processing enzyme [Bienertia sinuspersici]